MPIVIFAYRIIRYSEESNQNDAKEDMENNAVPFLFPYVYGAVFRGLFGGLLITHDNLLF